MARPQLFPEDPLLTLEQGLLRANRRLGILVNAWLQARLKATVGERKLLLGHPAALPDREVDLEAILQSIDSDAIIGDTFTAAAAAKLFGEYRQTIVEIHKIRREKEKLQLEQRKAMAKLPPVDDAAVNAEIDRLIGERLQLLTGGQLLEMAHARISEERLLREQEEPAVGDAVPTGEADGT